MSGKEEEMVLMMERQHLKKEKDILSNPEEDNLDEIDKEALKLIETPTISIMELVDNIGNMIGIENLRQIPVLTRDQEVDLFQQFEISGSDQIREKLIFHNLRLLAFVSIKVKIRNYHRLGILSIEDLFQEGYFGLERAVDNFDWRRGNKFSTYAIPKMRVSMARSMQNVSFGIRVPIFMQCHIDKFVRARNRLFQDLGRDPSLEEIAKALDISPESAREIESFSSVGTIASLDKKLYSRYGQNDEENSFLDTLSDGRIEMDELIIPALRKQAIAVALKMVCHEREREILSLRFGLEDGRDNTLEWISKRYGITRERVRQIEAKALKKMRKDKRVIKLLQDFNLE